MSIRSQIYSIVYCCILLCVSCNQTREIDEKDIFKKVEKYENGVIVSIEGYDRAGLLIEKKFLDKSGVVINRWEYFYNKGNGLKERCLDFGFEDKFQGEFKYFYSDNNLEIGSSSMNADGDVLTISKRYDKEGRLVAEYQMSDGQITWEWIYNYDTIHNLFTEQSIFHYIKDDSEDLPVIETDEKSPICYNLDSLNRISSIIGNGFEEYRSYNANGQLFSKKRFVTELDMMDEITNDLEKNDRIKAERKIVENKLFRWVGNKIYREIDLINNDSIEFKEKIVF